MSSGRAKTWVSCYIPYGKHPDNLLAGQIWPFVQDLTRARAVKQFFFIRYGDERGPHIRLRLLPAGAADVPVIKRKVKSGFPGAAFVPYIPETERYGGPQGVIVAEQLFEASSVAALRLITDTPEWDYSRALAAAMQMHIGMLQAFGVRLPELTALCAHIAQGEMTPEQARNNFEKNFTVQSLTIVPALTALWEACENGTPFQETWFADWRTAMTKVGAALSQAQGTHQLHLSESAAHQSPLWGLYESYIHMTNNRLGITRADEAFIAYILQRSLQQK